MYFIENMLGAVEHLIIYLGFVVAIIALVMAKIMWDDKK